MLITKFIIFALNSNSKMKRKRDLLFTYLNSEGESYHLLPLNVPELKDFLKEKNIDLAIIKLHPNKIDTIGVVIALYPDINKISGYFFDGDGNLDIYRILKYTPESSSLVSRLTDGREFYEYTTIDSVLCKDVGDYLNQEDDDTVWRFYGASNFEELLAYVTGQKRTASSEEDLIESYKSQTEEILKTRSDDIIKFIDNNFKK